LKKNEESLDKETSKTMEQKSDPRGILNEPTFRIILAIVVMAVIGGSLVAPILPSMIEPLGTTQEMVGLVMSIYTLFALFSTPVHGVLADRFGRKRVLVPAAVLYGASGFSIAFTDVFYGVLILRALQGIGAAGMMGLGVTLIGDIFKAKARVTAMGYRSSAQSLVNTAIPFISGSIATIAWFYPFYIYILAIPLAIFISLRLEDTSIPNQSSIKDYFKTIFLVMKDKKTLWVYSSNLFIFIFLFCLIVYGPILVVEELNLSTMYTGMLLSVGSLIAAITAFQSGKLYYRFQKYQIVALGFLLCGIGLLLISLALSFIYLISCIVIWGVGFGLVFPTLNTTVTELVSSHLRAGVVSGFTAMTYIGQTVSPPLFGFILNFSDLGTVFFIAALLTLLPLSLTLIIRFVYRKI
jgi:MFS transporter, ACDE family, multidrug resistance protein